MSADDRDVDAADVMANGHSENTVTRFEAFSEKKLQKLRNEAVQGVAGGAYPLDVVSLDGHTEDGVELADGENEEFRESVREQLGDAIEEDATPDEEAEQGEGWGPTEVDFGSIWKEYSFPETVSGTQLTEALAVSDHTSFGRGGAKSAIAYGVEANRLIDCQVSIDDDRYDDAWLSGLKYKRGEQA